VSTQPDPNLKIVKNHYIYKRTTWDSAPIVLEQSKLVFFTVPKVGCSVFKQLFRRMMGLQIADDPNLSQIERYKLHVDEHNPDLNGLKYLGDYPIQQAQKFLTDPDWTRAIFLRDPKERALSAYLDKGQLDNASYIFTHCCETKQCSDQASATFEGFLQVTHVCNDSHWTPFIQRMEGRYWSTINFVGHMESIQQDTQQLLKRLPGKVWEQYGATGWGRYRNESIFSSIGTVPHASGAKSKLRKYYTTTTEAMVEDMYQLDYKTKLFGFQQVKLYP
jgi:Sulfotransferase family